jgi:cation diffusion facilitator CzcD-associated flavoprotein CzcO
MSTELVDIAIIGAGPYGLSIAAHLRERDLSFRIFGKPMSSWRNHMPTGMSLKSDGFASSLYDPGSKFTIAHYCAERGIAYEAVGLPVAIKTFIDYGMEFQKRFVPNLEETNITLVTRAPHGYDLRTEGGETVKARKVVVAAGITHFGHMPPMLADLPRELVTHSSEHRDLTGFRNRSVAVLGAGASAVDLAGLLHREGARVELVARRSKIAFHNPPVEPRPLKERLLNPRSGLGLGWRSRLCTDVPLVFHAMPANLRVRAVQSHLGPAPGWFAREMVEGKVNMHLSANLKEVKAQDGGVSLKFAQNGSEKVIAVDHLIAATGYKVDLSRLDFLHKDLRDGMKSLEETPVLNRNFESSVPGLYVVGLASANSFGPLTRFAYGAQFTAGRLSGHLASVC